MSKRRVGSSPTQPTLAISGCGSVGRAPRLGRGGPQFESGHPDKFIWAHSSTVEQLPLKEKVEGSNPSGLTIFLDFSSHFCHPNIKQIS